MFDRNLSFSPHSYLGLTSLSYGTTYIQTSVFLLAGKRLGQKPKHCVLGTTNCSHHHKHIMNCKGGIIILYGCNSAGGSGKLGLPSFQTDCCDCGQICICRVTGPEDLRDPFDSVNQQSAGEVFGTTDHDAINKAIKLQILQGDANRMFDRIITPAGACHAVTFTAKHPDLT